MSDIHRTDPDEPRPPIPPQPSAPDTPAEEPPPPSGAPVGPPAGTYGAPPQQDVWGVRPPSLDSPATYGAAGSHGSTGPGGSATGSPSGSKLDKGFSALQKSPLRRDTDDGIIGGVAAGVAKQLNISPAAARIGTIVLSLFFGSGIAAYLIAWALLPDQTGKTHVEQGVKGGNAQSLIITVLAGLSALGMLGTIFDGLGWLVPIALTGGLVYYVVNAARKGDGTTG